MALVFQKFVINEHVQAAKKEPGAVCIDWNMKSERHEGISTCEGMQEKFPDDVASTLGYFLSATVSRRTSPRMTRIKSQGVHCPLTMWSRALSTS